MGNQTNYRLQNLFFMSGIAVGVITVTKFVLPYFSDSDSGTETTQADNQKIVTEPQTVIGGAEINNTKKPQLEPDKTVVNDQPIKESKPNTGTKTAHYTAYADGTAVDNNTGLMWARCSVGQTWQNFSCVGEAKTYTWEDAFTAIEQLNKDNYLGYSDWRLPHIEELHSLIYCSTGFKYTEKIPSKAGGTKTVKNWCKGHNYQRPTIYSQVLKVPDTEYPWYWSSSPYANGAWIGYFNAGYAYDSNQYLIYHVRAVRSD